MRTLGVVLLWLGIGGWGAETVGFDIAKTGELPPGWTSVIVRQGAPARWVVHPDVTAPSRPNVLAQLSNDGSRYRLPIAIFDKIACKNGDLSAKFKLVSGRNETAGLVWRYQDPYNYYFVRADARDHNIVMFKVVRGNAESIHPAGSTAETFGVRHTIADGEWNILKIVFRDARFTVYFDHRKVFTAVDTTFPQPGKTGVCTRGDTIAYFDDFRIDKK